MVKTVNIGEHTRYHGVLKIVKL